jgi:hypothetical protein
MIRNPWPVSGILVARKSLVSVARYIFDTIPLTATLIVPVIQDVGDDAVEE